MHVLCMGRVRNISLVTRSIAAQANSRLSLAVRMLPCDARGTSSLLCVISLFLCFSVLFCFNTLLFQRIMPLSKPPLANSMSCHPRATCVRVLPFGEFNSVLSQSHVPRCRALPPDKITCHARSTCHIAGYKNSICHFENRSSPYTRDEYWRDVKMRVTVRSKHWKYATIRQMAYEFLFVFHCKYGRELNVSFFFK